jgi:hypothetical protein
VFTGTSATFSVEDVMALAKDAGDAASALMDFADPTKKKLGDKNSEFIRIHVTSMLDVLSTLSRRCSSLIVEREKLIDSGGSKLDRISQMVSRIESATHLSSIQTLENNVTILNQKFDKICNTIETLKLNTSASETNKPSYAAISALPKQPLPNLNKMSIVLKPTNSVPHLDSADKIKDTLQKTINPTDKGWQIVRMRKKGANEVIIDANSTSEAKRIVEDNDIIKCGLTASIIPKTSPKLIIRNIPRTMDEKEVTGAIYNQNSIGIPPEEFKTQLRIAFKTGRRDGDTYNLVIEVNPTLRKQLLDKESIYLGWSRCSITDFINVTRCYKCQSFGHIAKYCRSNEIICGHCAKAGHDTSLCPSKNDPPKCLACAKNNKQSEHSSRSPQCPSYLAARAQAISRVDYG